MLGPLVPEIQPDLCDDIVNLWHPGLDLCGRERTRREGEKCVHIGRCKMELLHLVRANVAQI